MLRVAVGQMGRLLVVPGHGLLTERCPVYKTDNLDIGSTQRDTSAKDFGGAMRIQIKITICQ